MSAHNYAKAFHDIALERGTFEHIAHEIATFKQLLEANRTWMELMDSPMVSEAKKHRMIEELPYGASFLALLKLLAHKNHMHLFFEVYDAWTYLAREHQRIAHVYVYTAQEIKENQQKAIARVLEKRLGKRIDLDIIRDEHLIGGIRVVHNGQSLDRSIARELEELKLTI
ncbi:MAG: ATP synthase F1 subunit delta [Acholeplasmataceae bacterium]